MKGKRIAVAIVAALLLFSCAACGAPEEKEGASAVHDEYYAKSVTLSAKIFEDFWLPSNRMMAYVPESLSGDIDSDLSGTAALWSYGATLTMVQRIGRISHAA